VGRTLKHHPLAELLPPMTEREYQNLKADMQANGLREPVTLYNDRILDGRSRYRACRELGIEPKFSEWDGRGSPLQFIMSMNLQRRHLTTSQRALLGANIKQSFEREARRRQGTRTDLRAELRPGMAGKASEQAARLMDVSARSIENAVAVQRANNSELLEAVKNGSMSISMGALIAKLPKADQAKILSLGSIHGMRRVLYLYGQPQFQRGLDEAAQAALIIKRLLKLLEEATEVVGDQEPQSVAQAFIQWLPVNDARMVRRLKKSIKAVKLFSEIDKLWRKGMWDDQSEKQ
jgi:hypothetical protein